MLRLVVVHSQRLYRECLVEALRKHAGLQVLDATGEISRAVDLALELDPDVVVVDASDATAIELIRALAASASPAKRIALGPFDDDGAILTCAEAGAHGFLTAECPLEQLGDELEAAYRGELRCARISAALLRMASSPRPDTAIARRYPDMTSRELEVTALIERGFSNKEIATELGIGVSTVKHHVHSILGKLKVRRRGQVASRTRLAS